jgi:glycosyltransferase involved in cell wall biosynthesis
MVTKLFCSDDGQSLMKILFVQKRYHSNQHFAMKSLLAHGHEVQYLVQDVGPSENYTVLVPKRIPYSSFFRLIEGVLYRAFKYKISRPDFGFPSLLTFYREIKSFDADVIIVKTSRLYSQLATIIGRILRKPVVLYNQNRMIEVTANKNDSYSLARALSRFALRPTVAFTPVPGILTGEKPLKRGKTYYIPLVVESSGLDRVKSYREDGRIKILSVGKYQNLSKKRHDLLVQSVHGLVRRGYDLSLTLVGAGRAEDARLKYLKDLTRKLDLESRVTFRLNIPNEKMNEVYAAHDLFVLPSRWEGYGYSVLEAMANGLPVIASDRAGASDCIDNGVNGYIFESDNLKSLTTAIENIVKDHVKLEQMGAASGEIARRRYNPDVYHDRLMHLLKEEFGLSDAAPSGSSERLARPRVGQSEA